MNLESAKNHALRIRAACYIRTSTDREAQEGSYELQRKYYTDMIGSDPSLEFAGCYGDPGASGRYADGRPEFLRLLRDCEDHKIDIIYAKSISRFARNITDLVDVTRRLNALGVEVYFERENLLISDHRSELLLNILGIIAEEESRSIGENVRLGLEARMSSGHPVGKVPYGYRRVSGDGTWVIKEEEAEKVRLAFRLAASGTSYHTIRSALNNDDAIHTEQSKDPAVQSASVVYWSQDRLRRTLRNVAYRGDVLTGKYYRSGRSMRANRGERTSYYIEGHHEPIVTSWTFERVQHMLDSRQLG